MLALAAAAVMVFLGVWQLHRYEERTAINNRIDSADAVQAVAMESVMTRPSTAGSAGPAPGQDFSWTKVTVTGQYDVSHEIQARARTVNGDVGFEIVTPLVLADGTAVLVDRGWIAPQDGRGGGRAGGPARTRRRGYGGRPDPPVGEPAHPDRAPRRPPGHAPDHGLPAGARDAVPDLRRVRPAHPANAAVVADVRRRPDRPRGLLAERGLHRAVVAVRGHGPVRVRLAGPQGGPGRVVAVELRFPLRLAVQVPAPTGPRPKPTGDRVEEADRRAAERAARTARTEQAGDRAHPTGDRVEEADRRTAAAAKPDLPGARTPD